MRLSRDKGCLGGFQPRVEVHVLVTLLGARALQLVLELVDFAPERTQLRGHLLNLP